MEEKYKGQTKRIWYQKGYREALSSLRTGDLRQWLNEKPKDHLVTDKDIMIMLGIKSE